MNLGQHREHVERNTPHLAVHGWRLAWSRTHKALCLWNDAEQHGFAMRTCIQADDPFGQKVGVLIGIMPPTEFSGVPVYPDDVPEEFFPALEEVGFTLL